MRRGFCTIVLHSLSFEVVLTIVADSLCYCRCTVSHYAQIMCTLCLIPYFRHYWSRIALSECLMRAAELGCVQDVCMSVCLSAECTRRSSASNYRKMVILQAIAKNQFPYVIIIHVHFTISSCTYTCTYTCMLAHAHRQTDIHTAVRSIIRSLRQFIVLRH